MDNIPDKKPDTAHERKSKDAAIGCLIVFVIVVIFVIWAMTL